MTNNYTYFIANWKMYGLNKSLNNIDKVIKFSNLKLFKRAKIIYCPPYTILSQFYKKIKKTNISVGAQNCHYQNTFGAFTGSVNSSMIKNTGAKYVILGHSEVRKEGDSDNLINQKIKSALSQKLKVIFCIGENKEDRRKNNTSNILKKQIFTGLKGIKNFNNILLAYEPVWSIGTGKILKFNDLENQIISIKKIVKKKIGNKSIKILYGGSVNTQNINIIKKVTMLDGFLIGGASQDSNKFIDIIKKTFK